MFVVYVSSWSLRPFDLIEPIGAGSVQRLVLDHRDRHNKQLDRYKLVESTQDRILDR